MKNAEIMLGIGTIFVSALALIFSILESRRSQKHKRLSVKPMLGFGVKTSAAFSRYALEIENYGIGPAIFKNYEFLVDGKTIDELKEKDGIDKLEKMTAFIGFRHKLDWQFLHKQGLIKEGKTIEIVGYKIDKHSPPLASEFRKALRRLKIKVTYSSLYESEKFTVEFDGKKDLAEE